MTTINKTSTTICFAAVGDIHGGMHAMVRAVEARSREVGVEIQFVLQVGDFEPIRHKDDLVTMACPQKYRTEGDFPVFATGRARFPWPLYFIGGNHEPYGYLDQIPLGGELVENCHYLGRAGCTDIASLRVAGISGIYSKEHHKTLRPPLEEIGRQSNRLYTYFNEDDLTKMLECERPDIILMHDWPAGIIAAEDTDYCREIMKSGRFATIGNDELRTLVDLLRPRLVICGHLHHAYRAELPYEDGTRGRVCCLPEIARGTEAVAIFQAKENGEIEELTACP